MAAFLNKNAELVVEHLGFFPLSFVDDVFNVANDLIYQATSELERFVETEQGAGEETEQVRLGPEDKTVARFCMVIHVVYYFCLLVNVQGIHQVETLFESAVDKNFDLFELYVLQNT